MCLIVSSFGKMYKSIEEHKNPTQPHPQQSLQNVEEGACWLPAGEKRVASQVDCDVGRHLPGMKVLKARAQVSGTISVCFLNQDLRV